MRSKLRRGIGPSVVCDGSSKYLSDVCDVPLGSSRLSILKTTMKDDAHICIEAAQGTVRFSSCTDKY